MNNNANASIVIIHFNPLERYPPVTNLLNFFAENDTEEIIVISTENESNTFLCSYANPSKKIKIKRMPAIVASSGFRIFNYGIFYLNALWILLKNKPKSVLYFETVSSWPALIYKKLRGHQVKLLAHYHEYTGPTEYANNMRLVKWMHKMESKMYAVKYDWLSQTNEVRLHRFINDHHLEKIDKSIFHVMPNYPSKNWVKEKTLFNGSSKIRLVYVGALGLDTMYLKETIDWVLLNRELLSLDFYAYNIDAKAKKFLQTINDDAITFHDGCNYEKLPIILKNYDVGLVIYKPVSENWIHNAPNKIFEYMACGLDIWFSKTMTYTWSISREELYPKIIPVDFEKLNNFNFKEKISRIGLRNEPTNYFYENVYGEIYREVVG